MSNILVIAEKPEVAKDISEAIIPGAKKGNGYFYGTVDNDIWMITSAFGHLLNLCAPEDYDERYSEWNLSDLPLYFPDWKLKMSLKKEDEYKKERLELIYKCLQKADIVISAGDPDDEGQLLIDEILDFCKYKGATKRVFINDSMPENIRKAFNDLKDNDEYRSLGKAASARRMADFCFGINETRLVGIKLGMKGLAVGRVQTPTLGLVVERDRLIEGHQKVKYYELDVNVEHSELSEPLKFKFKADKKYLEDNDIKHVINKSMLFRIGNDLENKKIKFKTIERDKTTKPPLPYNLTTLQSDMNKRFGYSMQKTLDITQSLRSKKAITYNRSDSQYLKEEHYEEAPKLFSIILDGRINEQFPMEYSIHSACFDDESVTAHHAIIPQANNINTNNLTEEEKNVYLAITYRYAMQFLRPFIQKVSVSTFEYEDNGYTHTFERNAYKTIDAGYTKYFGREKEEETEENESGYLPEGVYDGKVNEYDIAEKETKPPARYTEGTLAKDMASIAKYVTDPEIKDILKRKDKGKKGENGSIGTVATRGVIVKNLIERGFLTRKGKNITSTDLGRAFYSILPASISKADTTAKWWLIQETIKEGKEKDVNAIQKAVVDEFLQHKDNAYENIEIPRILIPKEKTKGSFDGKEIRFNREWAGHKFTDQEVADLLTGKEITFLANKKDGGTFTATGSLQKQTYQGRTFYGFKLKDKEMTEREGYITGTFKKKTVQFKASYGDHTYTEEEIEKLLAGEEIEFLMNTKKGERLVRGKLGNRTWQGKKFFGFIGKIVKE